MRKIKDLQKFKEMYVSGLPVETIASYFGITKGSVYVKAKKLGIKRKRINYEQFVIETLKKNGWFCELNKLDVSWSVIHRLLIKRILFKVYCGLKRGPGGNYSYRLWNSEIFKPEFIGKTFICLGRTGVVRLMMRALNPPENNRKQQSLTAYLRHYVTEAERIAILFHLGVRYESDKRWKGILKKRNIQIDGIYKPKMMVTK